MSASKHGVFRIAEFKALPDDNGTRGKFSALVSVFGNVDLGGDRVVKGAFTKSLDRWRASGDPIPVVWSHQWGDPNAHIGKADPDDVTETDAGLRVDGTLDLDNPFAAQVYRLLKERRVKEMSFGYEVRDEKTAKDGANELRELDLLEVGPTLKGMNPDTQLLGVKADLEAAAGNDAERVALAKSDVDALRGAAETILQVLAPEGAAKSNTDEPPPADDGGGQEERVPTAEADGKATSGEADEASAPDDYVLALQAQIESLKGVS